MEGDEESGEGQEGDGVAEDLVWGAGVGDCDEGGTGGDGDGDEAVVALVARGDEGTVVGDAPGGVVAEVEDEVFGDGWVEREGGGRGCGLGLGGGFGVGVFREPVGWVALGEGVVVGGGGGVLVGGFGAAVGVEESFAGGGGILFVAWLVEEGVGRVGESCGEGDGECGAGCGFEVQASDCQGDGEAHDGGKDRQETPGELEEG